MDEFQIIIKGYAQQEATGRWRATSTTTLISSGGKLVLVDPGMNPRELSAAFNAADINPDDIDIVTATHSHLDHSRNCRQFDKAKVLDLFSLYKAHKKTSEKIYIPQTGIKVIFTPGHVDKHFALLFNTAGGRYAIAGDVFWWEDDEVQKTDSISLIEHVDPVAKDQDILQASRKKLLGIADFIIPGHGDIFPVSD
jgi:glyoxylase-like metal-dependent hydrolase (beta-lactamase superfamily II)